MCMCNFTFSVKDRLTEINSAVLLQANCAAEAAMSVKVVLFCSVLDTAFHIQCKLKQVTNCLQFSMLCPEVFWSLCMSAASVLLNSVTWNIQLKRNFLVHTLRRL